MTLFARAVCDINQNLTTRAPKVSEKFLAPEHKYLISNYEDISIEKSAQAQLELAGCTLTTEEESDLVLLINNFEEQQGKIVMGVKTQPFSGQFNLPKKPYMLAM